MTFDPFGDFESRGYLRNNEGVKDPAEVKRLEHEIFRDHVGGAVAALRTDKALGYEDVLETHRRLFQTMYPWAGQDRTENAPDIAIVKGGRSDLFAYPDEIRRAAAHALTRGQKVEIMRERPGEVMGLLAYAHPFLEGNGRTIMVLHGEMCRRGRPPHRLAGHPEEGLPRGPLQGAGPARTPSRSLPGAPRSPGGARPGARGHDPALAAGVRAHAGNGSPAARVDRRSIDSQGRNLLLGALCAAAPSVIQS